MTKPAPHKGQNTRQREQKLKTRGQVIPFIRPQLSAPLGITKGVTEALQDNDPKERGEVLDRLYRAAIGQMTTGLSPAALALAYTDWLAHLALSPHRQIDLWRNAHNRWRNLCADAVSYLLGEKEACCPNDQRFQQRYKNEKWHGWPYNILASWHLAAEDWWQEASRIKGMTEHHQRMIAFMHMLALSSLSPENYPLTNPEMQEKIGAERGMNFLKGIGNAFEDIQRWQLREPSLETEEFKPGESVAVTEGKVVFRNALFELIQYEPKTAKVYPEPVLIIPAWIMKYYILDLSPQNSMVKYLVEQGHTVFMISWKNPDASYRNVGFVDYLKDGALQALDVVHEVIPDRKVQAVGYCIGGTLLSMLAAYLANKRRDILQTITLFAAQTDFTEAGGLMTFIDASQMTYLEDIMFSQGFLRGDQISAAFDLLKPRELIWHQIVQNYMLGERDQAFDLMAWDKDATRLPYRMHSEYLRELYLKNQLALGELEIDGETLDLDLIAAPMFVVSTEKDHIAPWKSVYKIHHLTDAEITFVLANKGHNGGIVSEPGHEGREYRIHKREQAGRSMQPGKWMNQHQPKSGSWWVDWHKWLANHSGEKALPPKMGTPIADAPGDYVHEH